MVARMKVTRLDTRKLRSLKSHMPDRFEAMLRGAAEEIVGDIKLSFSTGVSLPGSPPGIDTGALRASIRWMKERRGRYIVTDGVIYGAYLEIGTERMAARPFFTPVFEEWRARKFAQFARDVNLFS